MRCVFRVFRVISINVILVKYHFTKTNSQVSVLRTSGPLVFKSRWAIIGTLPMSMNVFKVQRLKDISFYNNNISV